MKAWICELNECPSYQGLKGCLASLIVQNTALHLFQEMDGLRCFLRSKAQLL